VPVLSLRRTIYSSFVAGLDPATYA
jgi:hypothetical protein